MGNLNNLRRSISLDGLWKFRIDPNWVGEESKWNSPEFDDDSWVSIEVPSVWEAHGYVGYDGVAWYRRRCHLSSDFARKRIYLEFGAVDYYTMVWVNGRLAGEHEGGYSSFRFDITGIVNIDGDNHVAVRVYDPDQKAKEFPPFEILDGKQGWDAFPSPPSEYLRVGGIWQSVKVIGVPEEGRIEYAAVRRTRISDGLVEIQLKVVTRRHASAATVNVHNESRGIIIVDIVPFNFDGNAQRESFNIHAKPGEETDATLSFKLNDLRKWFPQEPNLYAARVTLQLHGKNVDDYYLRFGVREFSVRNGRFFLNGSPLFLRGALVQGFYPSTIYVAPSEEYVRNEIALAKSAGLNLLRLHIKIFEPIYLDIADELGMMLWVELPIIAPKKLTSNFNERALHELREMIKRDINHPSVVIMGIFNELGAVLPPTAAEYSASLDLLVTEIRKLDGTRLVCQDSWVEQPKFGDFADGHWYYEIPRQTFELEKRVQGVRRQPFIVSEFGGWGLPDFNLIDRNLNRPFVKDGEEIKGFLQKHPAFNEAFTSFEQYVSETQKLQGEALAQQIKLFRTSDKISGYILTEFYDVPCEYNGILDYFRNKKMAYNYVAQSNEKVFFVFPPMRTIIVSTQATFPLAIVNHADESLRNVVLSYSLLAETEGDRKGRELIQGTKSFMKIPERETKKVELPLDIGEVNSAKHFTLQVKLNSTSKTVNPATGSVEILAVSGKWLSLPTQKTCILGEGEKIVEMLKDLSVKFERFEDELKSRLQDFDAVIVVGQVGKVVSKDIEISLAKYAARGGRVIVLAQTGKFDLFSSHYSISAPPEPWLTPFSFAPPNELMKSFKTGLLGYELFGLYPRYVLTELPEDHKALSYVVVVAQPRKFTGVSLARKRIGKGDLVLCQFDLNDGSNPSALLMLRNLLAERRAS